MDSSTSSAKSRWCEALLTCRIGSTSSLYVMISNSTEVLDLAAHQGLLD
jgi:hypothetical protein